ncbi:MAG: C25 family cysteine peptidase [Bacteroidota bacterium]
MKKRFLTFLLFIGILSAHSQNQWITLSKNDRSQNHENSVTRIVKNHDKKGVNVEYRFSGMLEAEKNASGTVFDILHVQGFNKMKSVGKPALPEHCDLVLIPKGSTAKIHIRRANATTFNDLLVYPALKPATDREGDPEPAFEIDSTFYNSNTIWPDAPVKILTTLNYRGYELAVIAVYPVQYNPKSRTANLFSVIDYDVEFIGNGSFPATAEEMEPYLGMVKGSILNGESLRNFPAKGTSKNLKSISGPSVDYIIITHDNYLAAADSLAKWKAQLGYTVEIVSRASWTSSQVKSEIQQRYANWNPKPGYFVIIGDHDLVPGEIHQDPTNGEDFATDLYYACMGGTGDYVADMAFGRISVSSALQANMVVQKIIQYEKNPPLQSGFYSHGTNCAQFQDDDANSYEDRRFALTAEEVRNYMVNQQSFSIDRVYATDNSVTPLYWNNDLFAAGEPVPSYLRKPTFAWTGSRTDITSAINSADGRLFLLHRDHGYVGGSGWATPEYVLSDINNLTNGANLPVVFSINCHTGEYQLPECFSEKFLRKANGGAVGVFGAAYYSYSGPNDGLTLGFFDAIWPNPGIIPNFTGYGDNPVGSITAHPAIYTMGDVLNQGLLRMVQTWGDDSYTHELFHYFGDPAMQMWTGVPVTITASHTSLLQCSDSVLQIFSSTCPAGLATLVVDGNLVAETTLAGGTGTLHFAPLAGTEVILTISKHNYRPYIARIPMDLNCVSAAFTKSYNNNCVGENIVFTNESAGTIVSWDWNFGAGATPATASTVGPHNVTYTTPGMKYITLAATGTVMTSYVTDSIFIESPCTYVMQPNSGMTINNCGGQLFDNGGTSVYSVNSNDTATITAAGATSLTLYFNDFDIEAGDNGTCNYDRLEVFDGPNTSSASLGVYCNLAGHTPPASLTTSGGSFTVKLYSDGYVTGRGFVIQWVCSAPNAAPSANFSADVTNTCSGNVQFTDLSSNNPTYRRWDFGDGDTSNLQNPLHNYQANGIFSVTLTASNTYGNNTIVKQSYINVNMPAAPAANDAYICNSGSATLSANGQDTIQWFSMPSGGTVLHSGPVFTSPVLSANTTYYVGSKVQTNYFTQPHDSALGAGAYYTGTSNHYLIFNALQDIKIVSVKIYAYNSGNRTIRLMNSAGTVLLDTIANLQAGTNRVYLNWNVATGNAYRLGAQGTNNYLYRNSAGAVYPYTIPGYISITGNSYTNTGYYYYFYDWEIEGDICYSPRLPVNVYVSGAAPVAGFTVSMPAQTAVFTNTTTNGVTYSWNFGDGGTSNAENPVHTYTADGTYYVTLAVNNGCGSDIFTDTLYVYGTGINENNFTTTLSVFPNPANNLLNIGFMNSGNSTVNIGLYDATGRMIRYLECGKQGYFHETIDLGGIAEGIYLLRLHDGNQAIIKKVIVTW